MKNQIIDFLRNELIGPDPVPPFVQPNGEEILIIDPPRLRYGAGVLFPQASIAETSVDADEAETADPEIETISIEEDRPEPEIEGEDRVGDEEEEPTDATDETITLANAFLPSALGLSCLTELPPEGFVAEVRAATYRTEPKINETYDGETREGRQYLRFPFHQVIDIPAGALDGDSVQIWRCPVQLENGSNSGLELRIFSRPRPPSPEGRTCRLLTVTLVNTLISSTGRPENEKCFFQVELQIMASGNSACFLEYPEREGEALDDEDESIALLYRHRKTYAIGHGCAAEWNEVTEVRANLVRSEIIPAYEIKPIVPKRFEDLELKMIDLSDLKDEKNVAHLLGALCDKYEAWIDQQQSIVERPDFPNKYQSASMRHLERCRLCLARMRAGIALLLKDPLAMKAFRLANRAILLQQLHYSLPLREWKLTKGSTPIIPTVDWPDLENPPLGKGSWYPFQVAFILMNIKSLVIPTDSERNIVDLIWFPTGGGKTEAYLGLTAFAILLRRLRQPNDAGTTVLMRYTLRLLTAQQFQRAASLICALETLRRNGSDELGAREISIGLWVGMGLTPNKRAAAVDALTDLSQGKTQENPFIVLKCPWCGAQIGAVQSGNQSRVVGYERTKGPSTVLFRCKDSSCYFSGQNGLPLSVIDEDIYAEPPTLLIGTVDKFAMLPWRPEARALFGLYEDGTAAPPDLIIQDELHLISGPLGSMVGHYETVIQEICTRRADGEEVRPKVIASTATISRAAEQCHALYNCGVENVFQFPPQCLRAGDSFFAYEDELQPGRTYVGIHASALSSHVTAQVRVLSTLLQAPLLATITEVEELDPYWTLICYFNSLRELGHAATLIRADIREYLNAMWLRKGIRRPEGEDEDVRRFINVALEITSRISSTEIPKALQQLERSYPVQGDERPVDICLATNMISAGVDVARLGLMAVIGQPKTTSEYIQATSRVGRRYPGLVVTIYNTCKPRDRSHYEHFRSYHASIYRQVEPTSVTPFAAPVLERALHALLITLVRYLGSKSNRESPQPFPEEIVKLARQVVEQRVASVDPSEIDVTLALTKDRLDHWKGVLPSRYGDFGQVQVDIPLMYPAGTEPSEHWEEKAWPTPSSMRNVDATCEAAIIGMYPQPEEI